MSALQEIVKRFGEAAEVGGGEVDSAPFFGAGGHVFAVVDHGEGAGGVPVFVEGEEVGEGGGLGVAGAVVEEEED